MQAFESGCIEAASMAALQFGQLWNYRKSFELGSPDPLPYAPDDE